MLRIVLEREAAKALDKTPEPFASTIWTKIRQLADDPSTLRNMVKQLRGTGEMRLRVGNWRVFYAIEGETLRVRAIEHRRDAYR